MKRVVSSFLLSIQLLELKIPASDLKSVSLSDTAPHCVCCSAGVAKGLYSRKYETLTCTGVRRKCRSRKSSLTSSRCFFGRATWYFEIDVTPLPPGRVGNKWPVSLFHPLIPLCVGGRRLLYWGDGRVLRSSLQMAQHALDCLLIYVLVQCA